MFDKNDLTDKDASLQVRVPYLSNTAILERDPVYGFWQIHLERGESPKEFDGMFTDIDRAKVVIQRLENKRKSKVTNA